MWKGPRDAGNFRRRDGNKKHDWVLYDNITIEPVNLYANLISK